MTTTTFDAATVKLVAFGDLEEEFARTRRMLERVPDEHSGWKPHEKSATLFELAAHLANLTFWYLMTIQGTGFDMTSVPDRQVPANREELLSQFDDQVATVKKAFEQLAGDQLTSDWTLRSGEHVIFTQPKCMVLRSFCISHMAHHRGQLSVYLRLLGVPLPQTYGPTADDRPT